MPVEMVILIIFLSQRVTQYITHLKKLSTHCSFGDTLNERLRDQIVVGLKSESIQKRLLSESKLTYDRACELAKSLETAAKDIRAISRHPTGSTSVNHVSDIQCKLQAQPQPT